MRCVYPVRALLAFNQLVSSQSVRVFSVRCLGVTPSLRHESLRPYAKLNPWKVCVPLHLHSLLRSTRSWSPDSSQPSLIRSREENFVSVLGCHRKLSLETGSTEARQAPLERYRGGCLSLPSSLSSEFELQHLVEHQFARRRDESCFH